MQNDLKKFNLQLNNSTMKQGILIAAILLLYITVDGQNQADDHKSGYKFDIPIEWKEITNKRVLRTDSIFDTRSGFRINADLLVVKIGDADYVIVRYPDFKKNGKGQNQSEAFKQLLKELTPEQQKRLLKLMPTEKTTEQQNGNETLYVPLEGINGKTLCMLKKDFDTLKNHMIPVFSLLNNTRWVGGQLTVPFKLRPSIQDKAFQMTTDVTIGAYAGLRFRLSRINPFFITVPATLGLTFININDNTTTTASPTTTDTKIVPGVTWSSGAILQLGTINVGFVFGCDYASEVKKEWIYQGKFWYSFAIGFSFLK